MVRILPGMPHQREISSLGFTWKRIVSCDDNCLWWNFGDLIPQHLSWQVDVKQNSIKQQQKAKVTSIVHKISMIILVNTLKSLLLPLHIWGDWFRGAQFFHQLPVACCMLEIPPILIILSFPSLHHSLNIRILPILRLLLANPNLHLTWDLSLPLDVLWPVLILGIYPTLIGLTGYYLSNNIHPFSIHLLILY